MNSIYRKLSTLIRLYRVIRYLRYDLIRLSQYPASGLQTNAEAKLLTQLAVSFHVVEKGLTMPETKMGFGVALVNKIIQFCNVYLDSNYSIDNPVFTHTIMVLNEYVQFHILRDYDLPPEVVEEISNLCDRAGIHESSQQWNTTPSDFFSYSRSSFDQFCRSRHSVRNYSKDKISDAVIRSCIALAQTAPSACNRQPVRTYIVIDPLIKKEVLSLQNGNRGFGHLAPALIVVSSDLNYLLDVNERNDSYINAGLFTMNLLYALHFHSIGSCILNWSVDSKKDNALRSLVGIPENETISVIVACGYPPQDFKIALSPRLNPDAICRTL